MPRGAPRKDVVRQAVTYKLPPALLDRVAVAATRRGCTRTHVVERALAEALGGVVPPTPPPSLPRPARQRESRANAVPVDPAQARAAAFKAATQR